MRRRQVLSLFPAAARELPPDREPGRARPQPAQPPDAQGHVAVAVARARSGGRGFTVLVAAGHPVESLPDPGFPVTVKRQLTTGHARG